MTMSNKIPQYDDQHYAVVDLGSNSFHLLIIRLSDNKIKKVNKVKRKVRLAAGLNEQLELSADAINRGLDCISLFAKHLTTIPLTNIRIVATATLRIAKNRNDFLNRANEILPVDIKLLSGEQEAETIYSGVAHTCNNNCAQKRLVIDIGGGSTEFIIGEGFETKVLRSLQMGCVSYTNRFFKQGEIKQKYFNKAITSAQQELEMIDRKYKQIGWNTCIGTSGTIKIIIELAAQLDSTNRENLVCLTDLLTLMDLCCAAGNSKDLQIQGLTDDRRPVFAGGLAILIGVFKSLDIQEMEYSQDALREGVLYEMEEHLTHPDIRQRSAESLATRYDVDVEQAKRVLATTMALYQQCNKAWKIENKELKNMLAWSALLHEVGLQINTRGIQRHSAYILQNIELPGFGQEQQNLLATLTRFYRKKIKVTEIPEFTLLAQDQVYKLIALLRLGVLLNIKRQNGILPEMSLKADGDKLHIQFPETWLEQKPVFSADIQRESDYIQELGFTLSYN